MSSLLGNIPGAGAVALAPLLIAGSEYVWNVATAGDSTARQSGTNHVVLQTLPTDIFFTNKHCMKKPHHPRQPWWIPPLRHDAVGAFTAQCLLILVMGTHYK
jgi:hypothetical protein